MTKTVDNTKYIVDARFFRGYCITCMSDGEHNDYGNGETLDELRVRENNPHLIAVSMKQLRKMMRIHHRSLIAPFVEITDDEYDYLLDVLPPIRHKRHSFFLGEPYSESLHMFCFTIGGRYFKGLRSVRAPQEELERQMSSHYKRITYHAPILKEPSATIADGLGGEATVIAYSFINQEGETRFIGNLVTTRKTEEVAKTRQEMARTLRNLRKHHFRYFSGYQPSEDMVQFLGRVMERKQTILIKDGTLLQYPTNRESVSVSGSIKETGEAFFFRIYDRELFLYLMACLRGIKRERSMKPLILNLMPYE